MLKKKGYQFYCTGLSCTVPNYIQMPAPWSILLKTNVELNVKINELLENELNLKELK